MTSTPPSPSSTVYEPEMPSASPAEATDNTQSTMNSSQNSESTDSEAGTEETQSSSQPTNSTASGTNGDQQEDDAIVQEVGHCKRTVELNVLKREPTPPPFTPPEQVSHPVSFKKVYED